MKRFMTMGMALVFLTVYAACNKNIHSISGSSTHPRSLTPPAGAIDVTTTGATANDTTTDNAGFQKAIDSASKLGYGTVWVPSGTYMINVKTSILLKSNIFIMMASGAVLQAEATDTTRYYVFKGLKVGHIQVLGGEIIGDRNSHLGTTGEWGMGFGLYGCDSVAVKYMTIKDCWGDAFSMSSRPVEGAPNASTRIYIISVTCDSNRRQGVSIGAVSGVTIDSCTITNTNGTAPQDGIDIEPDSGTARNINIRYNTFLNNAGNGVEMNAKVASNPLDSIYNVNVQYNVMHYNKYAGYLQNVRDIDFNYDSVGSNTYQPWVSTAGTNVNLVDTPNYPHN